MREPCCDDQEQRQAKHSNLHLPAIEANRAKRNKAFFGWIARSAARCQKSRGIAAQNVIERRSTRSTSTLLYRAVFHIRRYETTLWISVAPVPSPLPRSGPCLRSSYSPLRLPRPMRSCLKGGAALRREIESARDQRRRDRARRQDRRCRQRNCRFPQGAQVIDLGDATLSPGFMDAHTHLTFDFSGNYNERPFTTCNEEPRTSAYDAIPNARDHARGRIHDGARSRQPRQRILSMWRCATRSKGTVVGPRMLVATKGIGATGGHFDDAQRFSRQSFRQATGFHGWNRRWPG